MQAVEDEQRSFFDCPFYSIFTGQHFLLSGPNYQQRDVRPLFETEFPPAWFCAHCKATHNAAIAAVAYLFVQGFWAWT